MKALSSFHFAFLKRHWRVVAVVGGVVVVAIIGGLIVIATRDSSQSAASKAPEVKQEEKTPEPPPPPPKYYSQLTGLEVADEATSKKQVKGIMIENSPDARPQSGLKDAGVVFEAIAEGGITRFLALYQESKPGLIGPVRSVRPYYVEWLAPFDATVAHVGGSKNALDTVRNGSFKDVDQFFNPAYYWRATDRYAPHNVYTNSEKQDAMNQAKGFTSSKFTGFTRKDDAPRAKPDATKINIDISYNLFNVSYQYDQPTNSYFRYLAGQKHLDREGGHILAKVAIVMKVPASLGLEDGYRLQMQTNGSGEVTVFQDGGVTKGTWAKRDRSSQITFTNLSGEPILLNRGPVWISVIAPDKSTTWQ